MECVSEHRLDAGNDRPHLDRVILRTQSSQHSAQGIFSGRLPGYHQRRPTRLMVKKPGEQVEASPFL